MKMEPCRETIAALIPWYVNGTLGEEERLQVDAHVPECAACRALLEHARLSRDIGERTPAAELEEGHVDSRLLVRFHEAPGEIDSEPRGRIQLHLDRCAVCHDALSILEELSRMPPSSALHEVAPVRRGFWRVLVDRFLGPGPALAYLMLVMILVVWQPSRVPGPAENRAIEVLPLATRLSGEMAFRTGSETRTQPPPVEISIPDSGVLLVDLMTDIDEEELEDTTAAFRLELNVDGKTLWSDVRRSVDFDSRGRLSVLLDPEQLTLGNDYTFVLRFERPGSADHGLEVFRRSFRVSASHRP